MGKEINKKDINLRYNVMTILTYVIGVVLIIQLFVLQIIKGSEYREQSNTRLTRESVLEAARGTISDRTGEILVTSDEKFKLELYKSKIDNDTLNDTILKMVNVLEKYNVSYIDSFPVKINPFEFTIKSTLESWKKNYKLEENASAEDAFYYFKEKYDIKNQDISEIRKIIAIRYAITKEGYSSIKALTISENIPREAVAEFSERSDEFAAINISVQPIRKYTQGTLAAHVLGYASKISAEEYEEKKDTYSSNDLIGKTGIEYVFEKYLRGQKGIKQIDMAVDGTITAEVIEEEAVAGADIVLTIDSKLQAITEKALADNIEKIRRGGFGKKYDAKGGACVVMNVKTGEVLSIASYPTYNPRSFAEGTISTEEWNSYINNDSYPLIDKTIQSSYAPGSIFKMVTAIAGLESGVINTGERINDTGLYHKYNMTWPCWYYTDYHGGHGFLNVSEAIKHSCNYFFYETGDRMGIDQLYKYASYFGLGKKTGIELPGEKAGILASKEAAKNVGITWGPGQVINASIGQGLNEFTPIQMAKYISMIANGGKNVNVSLVKSITYQDGTKVSNEEINKHLKEAVGIEKISQEDLDIKPEYLNAVLEGMKSVTYESGGTAYSIFKGFNIQVGGKTGSAEAANKYVNAWFAGFAPFDNPEIAVVIMVENGGHGNYTAEAVRDIISEYFGMNTKDISEDITAKPYTESIR